MQIQAVETEDQGYVLREKTLETEVQGLKFSFICTDIRNQTTGKLMTAQCVLYNGMP
jgi:hypothetical protein